MKVLGMITTGVLAIIVIAAVTLAVMSIPDIRKYLRMRSM